MNAETTPGTLVFIETLEALDFEPQCEHSGHDESPEVHAGGAGWLATVSCINCDDGATFFACDKWVQYMRNEAEIAWCPACQQDMEASEWFTLQTWVKL